MDQASTVTETAYIRGLDNPYFRIFQLGADVWNSWVRTTHEPNSLLNRGLALTPKLSPQESLRVARAFGTAEPPNSEYIDFSHVEFSTLASFAGYLLPNFTFYGAVFRREAIFTSAKFLGEANFVKTEFSGRTRFIETEFCGSASFQEGVAKAFVDFSNARFNDFVDFHEFCFESNASFAHAVFRTGADFTKCSFGKTARFDGAKFHEAVDFQEGRFLASATFRRAEFHASTSFQDVVFSKKAEFTACKFFDFTTFEQGKFLSTVEFSNAEFKARTDFIRVAFHEAPLFHESALHQDTSFLRMSTIYVPIDSASRAEVTWDRRARAWRTLKQKMSEVHAHDEERRFFALEMEAKSHFESFFSQRLTRAYANLSHFGWSILRPFYAIIAIYVVSLVAYLFLLKDDYAPSVQKLLYFVTTGERPISFTAALELLAFTATGSIPLFGHKDLAESFMKVLFAEDSHFWVYAISVLQGIFSAIFIFLMLLAVRNRYRIK